MKSLMKLMVAVAVVIAGATYAKAAQTATLNVTLNMSDLHVENIGGAGITLQGGPSQIVIASTSTGRGIFRNTGATSETFHIQINDDGINWALVTSTNTLGADQYRLRAIWHQFDAQPVASEYQDNDIMFPGGTRSNANAYFDDNDPGGVAALSGQNVPVLGERNLFIMFETPASGSAFATETSIVTVTAEVP